MKPEEALALLGSQFGDEKIRIFATEKIAQLDDHVLSLYMPQLVQALKYELFHDSVLSAFLIERAIKNTSVIGHSFYWSLKASLHSKDSFERLYLVLERFLMTSGSFKFRLYNQTLVNRALLDISFKI
jgi:phosphatidylinositol-4,5-bisphosphate 3-kinase